MQHAGAGKSGRAAAPGEGMVHFRRIRRGGESVAQGSPMVRGVSGGQKKRVTTGEVAVGPQRVLFADEVRRCDSCYSRPGPGVQCSSTPWLSCAAGGGPLAVRAQIAMRGLRAVCARCRRHGCRGRRGLECCLGRQPCGAGPRGSLPCPALKCPAPPETRGIPRNPPGISQISTGLDSATTYEIIKDFRDMCHFLHVSPLCGAPHITHGMGAPVPLPAPTALLTGGRCRPQRP